MQSNQGQETAQQLLFPTAPSISLFPPTRYQGSKLRLLKWIWAQLEHLEFDSCLDLFSGTSAVSYMFKVHGKSVTANDKYKFNSAIARALVANDDVRLPPSKLETLFESCPERPYDDFVSRTFDGMFFLPSENREIDLLIQNIHSMLEGAHRDLALFALFQACLAKRPYNLFHRANLYMRTSDVERSFGNKVTWDRPLIEHMQQALRDANGAVFGNGRSHKVLNKDFSEVSGSYDLVYMDPPYLNAKGTGVDYLDFYHFLEGLCEYDIWEQNLATRYKHKPYHRDTLNPWNDSRRILSAFDNAIGQFPSSIVAISYRSQGIPSIDELVSLLDRHGRRSLVQASTDHRYVLSTAKNREVLLLSGPAAH